MLDPSSIRNRISAIDARYQRSVFVQGIGNTTGVDLVALRNSMSAIEWREYIALCRELRSATRHEHVTGKPQSNA